MKHTESIQNIIKEVEKKKDEIASKKTEILTLQHQNVVLSEQAYIQKDKLYMLEAEYQDRKRIFENLYIKYKKKNQNMQDEEFEEADIDESINPLKKIGKRANRLHTEMNQDDEKEKKNQQEISDLRVLEGIQNYLDKQIQKYDKNRMMKQLNFSPQKEKNKNQSKKNNNYSDSSSEDDNNDSDSDKSQEDALLPKEKNNAQFVRPFNPFTCVLIRFKTNKVAEVDDGSKLLLSIRVEEKTKFIEIKRAACQYWQVKDPNQKDINGILSQAIQKDENFSFMDLCDETNSSLPDSELVIQFLMQKGYKNLGQCTLILKPKEFRTGLDSLQAESTRINKGVDQEKSQGQYFVKKVQNNSINPYDFFFQEYPSLQFYIELKQLHESESGDSQQEEMVLTKNVNDSHCCILTFLIMIIVVTAIYLSKMIDVEIKHFTNTYITNTLKLDKLNDLQNDAIFDNFLKLTLSQCFFDSRYYAPNQAYFKDNFATIGNIRIRFQMQNLTQCDIYANSQSKNVCFNLDETQLLKKDIGSSSSKYQFQKFQNGPTDKNQRFDLKGTYGTYSPEGYMLDFNVTISRKNYQGQIDLLKNLILYELELRVIIVTFTLYNPTLDIWVNVNIIIERDRYGSMIPSTPKIYFFKPNIYEGPDGSTMLALDIIRLVSTVILLIFVFYQIYLTQLSYVFSLLGFLNITVIGFSVASLALSFLSYSCGFDENKLFSLHTNMVKEYDSLDIKNITLDNWIAFQNKYYVDLTYVGYLYTSLQSIQSILITILLFRFIFVFSFSIYLKTIVDTIKNAGGDLLKYFIILLPLLISFALIFYQIWGAYIEQFNNLTASLCSVILMTIGYMNADQINQINTVWSIIFVVLFYLLIIFLFYSFILGIMVESQHSVIMQKGYPSMQKSTITGVIIIQWLFQWVPEVVKDYFSKFVSIINDASSSNEKKVDGEQNSFDETQNLKSGKM
ncbi:cation channel family transporter (macronuclear) [Tetrahymena thermophila SB210]|uniref:Cation channel family transporter n=1 Tax=Tetrahymena thermophila (strain SB210) TaxID=312017 RepID=I7MHL0_TETTS|nr:cation channel family transporter [Tetrahymena thermophila SB210]EAS03070.2 cation channel family transporter [Tetrahymena thermophila SB210]|eukprot:XP_001023315.2 cation channel family transporter [Tetrahymena thermophila SB210]